MRNYKNSGIIISFVMIIISSSFFFSFANAENSEVRTVENDKKIEELKKQYVEATEEFKNGPIKFIEDRLCKEDSENHKKSYYENSLQKYRGAGSDNLQTYNCYQYFLKDPQKAKYESETWFTFENLKLQATWLNELNELRANDDNFTSEDNRCALRLCPELMMESMMSALIGYYQSEYLHETSHIFGGSSYSKPSRAYTENLSWYFKDDPFDGWYHAEKELYDNGDRSRKVGHYEAIMSKVGDDAGVGFGMYGLSGVGTEKDGVIVWDGQCRGCDAMRLGERISDIQNCPKYTADEWLKEVNAYEKKLQDKVDKAKQAWEAAKYEPEEKVNTSENLVYNGDAQPLVTNGTTRGGKLLYSLDEKKWSEDIPTATNAGEYTVYYKVEGTDYYKSASVKTKKVVIKKADPVVTVKFADPDTLVMDPDNPDKEFNLVKESECNTTGGTLQFYDESIGWNPSRRLVERYAGKYTVRYRVKGDDNYNDVPEQSKELEIKKVKSTADVEFKDSFTYDPSETWQSLLKNETHTGLGTVEYQIEGQNNNEWNTGTPFVKNVGTYKIRWRLRGTICYDNIPESEYHTVTIKKAPQNPSIEFADNFTCDGKKHYLVHQKDEASSAPSLGKYNSGTILYKVNDSDWTEDVPIVKDAGTYKVSYKIEGKTNWEDLPEQTKTITVSKRKLNFTIKPAKDAVYTGNYINLFTASYGDDALSLIGNYELFYKINDGAWTSYDNSFPGPVVKKAGMYKVKYKVDCDGGYESIPEKEFTVTIAKKTPTFASAPYEAKSWTYSPDSSEAQLCRAKASDKCTVLYSLNNSEWTSVIPTASNAGTYNVRYKIQGNENVADGDVHSFTVIVKPMSIDESNYKVSVSLNNGGFKYTQSYAGEEINPVKKDGVSVTYGSNTTLEEGKDYTLDGEISSATPGIHRIIVKGKGNLTGEREIQYKIVAPNKTDKPDSGNTDKPDSGNMGGNTGDSGSETPSPKPQKKDPEVTATLAKNLVFNYRQQKLCTDAKTTGGMLYLTIDGTSLETPDKLTAKNPGTYTVKYQVYGNSEYNDASGTLGTVTIDKVDISKKGVVKALYNEELKLYSKESTQKQNVRDVVDVQNDNMYMAKDVDYSLTGDLDDISKPGTYSFTVHGKGDFYKGDITIPFKVTKMYSDSDESGGDSGNVEKPDPEEPDIPEPEEPKTETYLFKVKASNISYIYDGKVHVPTLKVYDEDGNLLSQNQYKITYPSGRKNLGSYMIVITGKGDCKGTLRVAYTITPAKMKTPSVKAGKKKLTVKWKKLGGGSQTYQISVLKKGTKKAKYYTSTGSTKTISKLTKKKYYTVRIRSYKRINGKTYYGAWSTARKVKVK